MKRNPEQNPESYSAWCARVDGTVEAKCANLSVISTAAAVEAPGPKPAAPVADPWSLGELAPRAKAELRTALRKMDNHDVAVVWAMWQAIGPNHHGCDTPAENFIHDTALNYLYSLQPGRRGMTPDDAARDLEEFRSGFRDALATTRRFNAKYSAQVQGPESGR